MTRACRAAAACARAAPACLPVLYARCARAVLSSTRPVPPWYGTPRRRPRPCSRTAHAHASRADAPCVDALRELRPARLRPARLRPARLRPVRLRGLRPARCTRHGAVVQARSVRASAARACALRSDALCLCRRLHTCNRRAGQLVTRRRHQRRIVRRDRFRETPCARAYAHTHTHTHTHSHAESTLVLVVHEPGCVYGKRGRQGTRASRGLARAGEGARCLFTINHYDHHCALLEYGLNIGFPRNTHPCTRARTHMHAHTNTAYLVERYKRLETFHK